MNTKEQDKTQECPHCGWGLMEWFEGNMVCARCGFDDSLERNAKEEAQDGKG